MKKILFAIAILGLNIPIFGQTFNVGILGGINSQKVNTATLSGGNSYTLSDLKSDAQMGYHIGAFARLGGKKVFLQPEILYSVKKANANLSLTDNNEGMNYYSQDINLKSIQVPVLIGYKLINLKLVSLRVFTGPAMSANFKSSQIKFTGLGVNVDPSLYDPNYLKDNIWDWWAGAGVDLGNLIFDVHYEWGITNISDANPSKISFNNKGNTLTFSLGFKFL